MLGLSLVLAITAGGRHYAVAGAVSACVALAAGICGPITGRLVDRHGQASVLVVVVAAFSRGRWPRWSSRCTGARRTGR